MQQLLASGVTEWISQLFVNIFGDNSALATILISIIPIIELKGAIPFGMSKSFWGKNALSGVEALLFALLGGLIVVILLSFLLSPVVRWLKKRKFFKKLAVGFENHIKEKSTLTKEKKTILKMLGVFLFVAVPLPLTGVWTGTAIAVFSGLKVWQSIICAFCGNVVAGILISFVCSVFPAFTTILFYIVIAIVIILAVYYIIRIILKRQERE